ncbi:MAG: hypothetical protein KHY35_16310 [Bacteroides thetaiotaomicron]|uniref:Lipoprotein n=1 Tax=Bacteroides thetaiotaomicron TaxID=818 RepID=A0A943DQS7_BACT4|nr:hypothetical protein [Bacteroides thetaiotaomicron]
MKRLIYVFIILLTSAIWLSSCQSIKYVPVESVKTEYKTRDSIRFDSIYQRDSVYVLVNGDTVYLYQYKYLYRYLTINKTDTVIKTDSIQIPYPVEKQLSQWQSLKMELGGWVFGLIIIVFIIQGWLIYQWRKNI